MLCLTNVIEFFSAKIIVFTGDTLENGKYAEIIDLSNPNAVCDPYVVLENGTYYSSGGRISENDYIYCGGTNGNNFFKECYKLGENSPFAELLNPQTSGSSVVLPNSTLFLTGKLYASVGTESEPSFVKPDPEPSSSFFQIRLTSLSLKILESVPAP